MSGRASTGLREEVWARYAGAVRAVLEPKSDVSASYCGIPAADSCCGAGPASAEAAGGSRAELYREGETDGLPEEAVLASLGGGNPTAVRGPVPGRAGETASYRTARTSVLGQRHAAGTGPIASSRASW
jgi:hypothetical protein